MNCALAVRAGCFHASGMALILGLYIIELLQRSLRMLEYICENLYFCQMLIAWIGISHIVCCESGILTEYERGQQETTRYSSIVLDQL